MLFFSWDFLLFFDFAGLAVSVDCDASCANTGAAKPIANAAVNSKVKSFFIRVATSLGLYFAKELSKEDTRLVSTLVKLVTISYQMIWSSA